MKQHLNGHPLGAGDAERILDQQLSGNAADMDTELMQACVDALYPDMAEECASDWEALQALMSELNSESSQAKPARRRSRRARTALLVAAIFLLLAMCATAVASVLARQWDLRFFWLSDRLTIEGHMYATPTEGGGDRLVIPADDAFGDALRRHEINHPFPPVPEGWTLVELIDDADEPYLNSIDAMYKKEGIPYGLAYTVTLPDPLHENMIAMMDIFKDPGDPIVDSYDGFDFYFFQNESYGNVLVDYGDCLFQLSSPASLEELREMIRKLFEAD